MKKLSMGVVVLGLILPVGIAGAADIKVLSTGNMQTVLAEITPDFDRLVMHFLIRVDKDDLRACGVHHQRTCGN